MNKTLNVYVTNPDTIVDVRESDKETIVVLKGARGRVLSARIPRPSEGNWVVEHAHPRIVVRWANAIVIKWGDPKNWGDSAIVEREMELTPEDVVVDNDA